ncbi:hypothetical protein [Deinococcus navajonensis]|uniref:Uncharacterized protein n=1 Tax=Deinococcus navajonensis TaxID=309884 RepID=A0ABV8XMU3_9DEIO
MKVTNTTSGNVLFSGTLETSKTFSSITAGSVVTVEPGAVNDYTAPGPQTVTLDADKTVALTYQAVPKPGNALRTTVLSGKVTGTDLALGNAVVGSPADPLFGIISLTNNSIDFDLATLVPSAKDLRPFGENCTGAQSDPAAQFLFNTTLKVYGVQGDLVGGVVESVVAGPDAGLPNAVIYRVYSDRAFTFKGTCLYTVSNGTTVTENSDITLIPGWNALVGSGTGNVINLRNASPDDRVQLTFHSEAPRVTVNLNPSSLKFSDDNAITVDANLVQVGGYSGTVNLSTDVPGLTVEPQTVVLPALPTLKAQSAENQLLQERLGALNLSAQKVAAKLAFRYTGTENFSSIFEVLVKDPSGQKVGSGKGTVQVSRPGMKLYASGYNLQLARNSTLRVPVTLQSIGNFTGAVTLSATELPAGVSVTPAQVNLNGSAYSEVLLTSDATVTPGTYPITLTAAGNGRTASTKVDLIIAKPGVGLNVTGYGYSAVNLYQNNQTAVEVNVTSLNGFNGTTTVTLEGLPAGVATVPTSATVTPSTTTTVKIPVYASVDAALGTYTIKVTSPDQLESNYGSVTSAQLNVMPQRTLVGTAYSYSSAMARSGTAAWVVVGSTTDYQTYPWKTTTTLGRYDQGKLIASALVVANDSSSVRLISLADSSVLVLSGYGTYSAFTVDSSGNTKAVTVPFSTYDTIADEADSQGRIWFLQRSYTSTGARTSTLAYWSPSTGAVTPVDATREYDSTYSYGGRFSVTPDGKTLVYVSNATNTVVKINAETSALTSLDLGSGATGASVAIRQDGTVWFTSNGQLRRVNTDGSITTFNDVGTNTDTLIGFDHSASHILWGRSYSGVVKINVSTLQVDKIAVGGSITAASTSGGGGMNVLTSEYSGQGQASYISYLK